MSRKRLTNADYRQRLKSIRPYVKFDYDLRKPLTPAAKRKITRYHAEIDALQARPYKVYRPRRADHLRAAQEFSQQETKLPELKVAFIPHAPELGKLTIRFDADGNLVQKFGGITTTHLQLDAASLLIDAKSHVEQVIKQAPDAKSFQILCGRYELPNSAGRHIIGKRVAELVERYSERANNNYFGNWLHGLAVHEYEDQADLMEYIGAKSAAKEQHKRSKENERQRARDRSQRSRRARAVGRR